MSEISEPTLPSILDSMVIQARMGEDLTRYFTSYNIDFTEKLIYHFIDYCLDNNIIINEKFMFNLMKRNFKQIFKEKVFHLFFRKKKKFCKYFVWNFLSNKNLYLNPFSENPKIYYFREHLFKRLDNSEKRKYLELCKPFLDIINDTKSKEKNLYRKYSSMIRYKVVLK